MYSNFIFNRLLILICFIFIGNGIWAQPGSLDLTFNANDNGFDLGTGANGNVTSIIQQNDGKIIATGSFTSFNSKNVSRIVRLDTIGRVDEIFNSWGPGADNTIYSAAIQSDGKIIIVGAFTSFDGVLKNRIVRLNTNGSLDATFNTTFGAGANGDIRAIQIQSDGKIIIGGDFSSYADFISTFKSYLVRLNSDGTIDNTFNTGTGPNNFVRSIHIQNDGKILIGGTFSTYNGTSCNRILRLNNNGSIDSTFNIGTGPNNAVTQIRTLSNGQIILSGSFTSFNSLSRNYVCQLNSNGSVDTTFNPGTGFNNPVENMAIQPDNKIILCGLFTSYNSITVNRFVRIDVDGKIDSAFNVGSGPSANAQALYLQNDGKIFLGGGFTTYNGQSAVRFVRLLSNGLQDSTYNSSLGANGVVNSLTQQSTGKIIVAGAFTSLNKTSLNRLGRLTINGEIDNSFSVGIGAASAINNVLLLPNDKLIVGGSFTSFNGASTGYIIRLNIDGDIDTTFGGGTRCNGAVFSIAKQTDNKIILGGSFNTYNGSSVIRIARINVDGSLDNTFSSGSGFNNQVSTTVIQEDGKILVGGNFTTYNGVTTNRITRLTTNGSQDVSFNIGTGFNSNVNAIINQPDGKIIVVGAFSAYNGTACNRIARLNTNGTIDTSFIIGTGFNGNVSNIAIQSDGKLVIVGNFTAYNGTTSNRIIRLKSNGVVDSTFIIGTGSVANVGTVHIQSDGKILIGGSFTSINSIGRNRIARLLPCSTPTVTANSSHSSICNGASVTLSATGASTYTWQPGNLSATPSVSPNTTTIYTVTGTSADGCTNTATYQVTVNALPNIGINSSASTLCYGTSASLEGTGASTYAWQPGNLSGSPVVSPTSNTTYTVVGTDANGCTNSATYSITVNGLPSVGINSSASMICYGASATLTGTGASSYSWQPGNLSGSPVVSPISNTTFTVIGTDENGCTNSSTTIIEIYPLGNPLCTLPPCGMPTSISATPTQNSGVINFTKSLSATSTFIQTRVKGTNTWGGTSTAGESYTFNNLSANTTYEYRLRSSCTGLNSAFTTIAEFTTLVAPPVVLCSAPTGISSIVNGNTSVTINWSAANNGALYFVQIKPSTATWAQAGGASTASTSRTFNYLQPGTSYDYRIRTTCTAATTSNGTSLFSAVGNFATTGNEPGLAQFNTENPSWSIYPNPATDIVNIEFTATEEAAMQLLVLDVAGRKVQEISTQSLMGNNQLQISLASLNKGLYFIQAIQGNEVKPIGKVTKQ